MNVNDSNHEPPALDIKNRFKSEDKHNDIQNPTGTPKARSLSF